ncbi:MAG: aminoacyl-tRNA hydrolase [Sedimentisphaerales bacterium]|nr:aminoacyl-tRNA hydrolase [Sedimentisphaerales bacterium]
MPPVTGNIDIAEEDVVFKYSRSGGPGGQNVNKLNTRVTLFFDVAGCQALSDTQKRRILSRLATRANKKGVLRVVSQKHRTQKANRAEALQRLGRLIEGAIKTSPVRKKTRMPRSAHLKRLDEKKRRGALKRLRSERNFEI